MTIAQHLRPFSPSIRLTAAVTLFSMPLRTYGVFAQDPDAEHIIAHVEVEAISRDGAMREARRKLAAESKAHFRIVVCEPIGGAP